MSSEATSRYETIVKLASGGMATVWVGTVKGALGFRQLVAIKKPHPHLLADTAYRNELVTEARLASLIRHANVIDVRDVEVDGEAISLVMDYIEGASLGELVVAASKRGALLSPRVAVRIALDALAGLRAVHELIDERGRHVALVHRDISPQNIVVGVDGLARVADFGVAKFSRKGVDSSEGSLKGKLAYMAPEYLRGEPIDHRFDLFAVGIVLWESLAGKRLFRGANEAETLRLLLDHQPAPISSIVPAAAALDGVLATALARPVEERFQNALAMATALESAAIAAGLYGGHTEVATALKDLVGPMIEERRALIRAKLAHEPSLASLMGVPQEALPAKTLLDTQSPHTIIDDSMRQATPRMGGMHDLPNGRTAPLGRVPATIADPPTMIPSTLPMTPRMDGAPVVRTLASAGPSGAPGPIPTPRGLSGATLPSAGDGGSQPRLDGTVDTQLSFNEPSARSAMDPSMPASTSGKSRAGAVIAAVGITIVVLVAVTLIVTRGSRGREAADRAAGAAAAAASASSAPEATSTSTSSTIAAPAASSVRAVASAAPSSTTAIGATTAAATRRGTKGTSAATGAAPAAPPTPATPTPPPAETSKKPPPNPYATE